MKKDNKKNYILHILLPCLVYSSAGGILTGAVIFGFRVMTDWLNKIAVVLYDAVCADLWLLPLFFLALAALAFLLSVILKWAPSANGGGIPTAMGILRGIVTFKWLRTFVGVIASSVITFFAGMPLCNDGPSVLIGASLGRGVNSLLGGKKGAAWDRYVMTGCAGAGFAAAFQAYCPPPQPPDFWESCSRLTPRSFISEKCLLSDFPIFGFPLCWAAP